MEYRIPISSLLPSLMSLVICLYLLYYLARRPSWLIASFFGFFLLGMVHLAGTPLTRLLLGSTSAFNMHRFWSTGLIISRGRYLFLVLFTAALHRFRLTPLLTGIMIGITCAGMFSPLIIYSILPNLMEIIVTGYVFICWLVLYLIRKTIGLSSRREGLLKALVLCSGFFLTGLLLDILKQIPQFSVYISILVIDFFPWYLLSVGSIAAVWAFRDLHSPFGTEEKVSVFDWRNLDMLPVTGREKEVLRLILDGETNASIADRLFISGSTVKKHINNSFRKLGIRSRWELLKKVGALHPKE